MAGREKERGTKGGRENEKKIRNNYDSESKPNYLLAVRKERERLGSLE